MVLCVSPSQQLDELYDHLARLAVPSPDCLGQPEVDFWQVSLRELRGSSLQGVSELAERAEALALKAKSASRLESQALWKVWVEGALERGAGRAHRYTKGLTPDTPSEVLHKGVVCDTPDSLMAAKAETWQQFWCKPRDQVLELREDILNLLPEARRQQQSWPELSMSDLEWAIKKTPVKTGLGFDQLSPSMLRSLSEEGKRHLLLLLRRMERELMLPAQALLNLVALIDRPDGGDRPITLLPMLYRLLIRMRRHRIGEWDSARAGHWDAAVKGSGALEATYNSELDTGLAILDGKQVAGALLDMAKL